MKEKLEEIVQSYLGMHPRDHSCVSWNEMQDTMVKEILELFDSQKIPKLERVKPYYFNLYDCSNSFLETITISSINKEEAIKRMEGGYYYKINSEACRWEVDLKKEVFERVKPWYYYYVNVSVVSSYVYSQYFLIPSDPNNIKEDWYLFRLLREFPKNKESCSFDVLKSEEVDLKKKVFGDYEPEWLKIEAEELELKKFKNLGMEIKEY